MRPERLRAATTDELAFACAMNRWECTKYLAESRKGYTRRVGSHFAAFSGIEAPWFNGVHFSSSPPAVDRRQAHDLLDEFKRRHLPGIFWLSGEPDGSSLRVELLAQGCTSGGALYDMAVDLYKLRARPSADAMLVKAESPAQLQTWTSIVGDAFEFPVSIERQLLDTLQEKCLDPSSPMQNYLLLHEGVEVAAGTLFISSGVAGTYCLAVRKQFHRLGYGRILRRELQQRIVEAEIRYQVGSCEESLTSYYAGARRIDLGRSELMCFG